MKKKSNILEHIVHGIFLILGLITVACVLVITIYLVVSGIPAIKEIGFIDFLFGENGLPRRRSLPMASCRLSLPVSMVRQVQFSSVCLSVF